ncbi:MAG TPA: MFS transporter [Acidimicrobiales bacterium]|jgi:EmrB/QacA subfamily drug resistance transporter|nr:MFS transporter [Acidimicrobiales bacterium]
MADQVSSASTRPAGLLHEDPLIYRRRWILLGIMCLSLVMVVMSVAGLNVALPSMQRSLDASASELQWIVDSYALVFAALLLFAGALGDRFGRKRALMVGLVVFGTGSVISGIGTGSGQIIVGRVITGIGAAFVMPATLSLISTIFPPEERAKAIAIWAGFAGGGAAIGPIVSGALLNHFWWGSALLVNAPVIAITLFMVAVFSPTSKDPGATPLDPFGAVLSLIGLGTLVYAIIEGPDKGWTSPVVLGAFAIAAAGMVAFFAWERRSEHPMLPLELFADRRMSVGSGVVTSAFFILFGLFFLFTLYLQFVRAYSPLNAGLATLPLALALVAIAPRSAVVAARVGSGPVMATGFVFVAAGFGVLATIGPSTPYLVLAVALVLLGAGMSLTAAPATASIMSGVPQHKAGVGSAVNDTTRELGGALGIAILGSIASAIYRSSVDVKSLQLPPAVASAARESIGGATVVAAQVPAGKELAAHAATAFTHAFDVVAVVGAVMSLVAAAVVAKLFSRQVERDAADAFAAASVVAADPDEQIPASVLAIE